MRLMERKGKGLTSLGQSPGSILQPLRRGWASKSQEEEPSGHDPPKGIARRKPSPTYTTYSLEMLRNFRSGKYSCAWEGFAESPSHVPLWVDVPQGRLRA